MTARIFVHPKAIPVIAQVLEDRGINTDDCVLFQHSEKRIEFVHHVGDNQGVSYYRRGDGDHLQKKITTLLTQ